MTMSLKLEDLSKNLCLNGVSSSVNTLLRKIYWIYDPIHWLDDIKLLRKILNFEIAEKPSSSHQRVRSSVVSLGNFPCISLFSPSDINADDTSVVSARQRSYIQAPISLMLHVIGCVYASFDTSRIQLNQYLFGVKRIPRHFYRLFKNVRESRCGTFLVTPKLLMSTSKELVKKFPVFKDTFLDFEFLLTEEGIQYTCSLLSLLRNEKDDYIDHVNFTGIPMLDAGYNTKLCSLFTSKTENQTIWVDVLSGSSLNFKNSEIGYYVSLASMLKPILQDVDGTKLQMYGNPSFMTVVNDYYVPTVIKLYTFTSMGLNDESKPNRRPTKTTTLTSKKEIPAVEVPSPDNLELPYRKDEGD